MLVLCLGFGSFLVPMSPTDITLAFSRLFHFAICVGGASVAIASEHQLWTPLWVSLTFSLGNYCRADHRVILSFHAVLLCKSLVPCSVSLCTCFCRVSACVKQLYSPRVLNLSSPHLLHRRRTDIASYCEQPLPALCEPCLIISERMAFASSPFFLQNWSWSQGLLRTPLMRPTMVELMAM